MKLVAKRKIAIFAPLRKIIENYEVFCHFIRVDRLAPVLMQ